MRARCSATAASADERLADEVVALLTDPVRRRELEQVGLTRASTYDWDVVAAAYERVYARVLEGTRRASA